MNTISKLHEVFTHDNVFAAAIMNPQGKINYEVALEAIKELVNEKNKHMEQPMKRLNGIVSHLNSDLMIDGNRKLILSYKARLESLMRDNFPFKAVSPGIVKHALTTPVDERLTNYTTTILQNLFLERDFKDELVIDESHGSKEIQILIENLDTSVLAQVLDYFKDRSKRKVDVHSSYIFCFLLKVFLRVNRALPKKNECTAEVMTSFTEKVTEDILHNIYPQTRRLMELTVYRSSRSKDGLLFDLLPPKTQIRFLDFAGKCLRFGWPWDNEGQFFITLLKIISRERQIKLSETLVTSTCKKTASFFLLVLQGLKSSIQESIEHLNMLKKMLPDLKSSDFVEIFDIPFMSLEHEKSRFYNDIPEIRRLTFNLKGENVIVDDCTIIGRYQYRPFRQSSRNQEFLLAYDLHEGTLQWAHPLIQMKKEEWYEESRLAFYQLTHFGIAMIYRDNPKLYFIEPKNGFPKALYKLTETPRHFSRMHFTPQGFFYYMAQQAEEPRKIYGCMIQGGELKTVFVEDTPKGHFMPLGEFIYFKWKTNYIIYSKSGKKYELNLNGSSVQFANNKIYTFQQKKNIAGKGEKEENRSVITTYQLNDDEFVLKSPQEVILDQVIGNEDNFFYELEVCEDGTCVIIIRHNLAYFVDPKGNM